MKKENGKAEKEEEKLLVFMKLLILLYWSSYMRPVSTQTLLILTITFFKILLSPVQVLG
jgi:hypothetical protein